MNFLTDGQEIAMPSSLTLEELLFGGLLVWPLGPFPCPVDCFDPDPKSFLSGLVSTARSNVTSSFVGWPCSIFS